jgi:4-hydroxy-tetrahydrodipicolinate synthase
MKFSGCYTAMVTPFRDGEVEWETLANLIEIQIQGGVSGLVPVGTTGESPSLGYEDHMKVIEFTVNQVAGRCQIIAGTGANSTEEAIMLTSKAKALGVDATLQVTPYYNKPTQEGLFQHFTAVANAVDLPIVLYNVPGRSGVPIEIETVKRLAKHGNIQAIKEAAGSVDRVSQIKNCCDLQILSGDDALTLPMMSVGATGVISVASNVIPAEMQTLCEQVSKGDFATALEIHQKYYQFFCDEFIETNPIPIKAALAMMGQIKEEYRLPMCKISESNQAILKHTMKVCGII